MQALPKSAGVTRQPFSRCLLSPLCMHRALTGWDMIAEAAANLIVQEVDALLNRLGAHLQLCFVAQQCPEAGAVQSGEARSLRPCNHAHMQCPCTE